MLCITPSLYIEVRIVYSVVN